MTPTSRFGVPTAFVFAASLLCAGSASAQVKPLSAEQRRIFFDSPEDTLDKKPCLGTRKRVMLHCKDVRHYVRLNEWHHYVWRPYVENLGGAYIGVGSDQNLTFVAWARSELVFLMDYDPVVVRVNRAHHAFILAASTPAEFVRLWTVKGTADALAVLKKQYEKDPEYTDIVKTYKAYRSELTGHFKLVLGAGKRRPIHWLNRDEDFGYVRRMVQAGRVRVMKGDLLKDKSLIGVGEVLRKLKQTMRVIYTSNAEEFWPYPRTFRTSFIKLPMDEKTVLLRTHHTERYGPKIGSYLYIVQGGQDFQKRLEGWSHKGLAAMMQHRRPAQPGFFTIGVRPKRSSDSKK